MATTTITKAMPSRARLTSNIHGSSANEPARLAAAIPNSPPVAARCGPRRSTTEPRQATERGAHDAEQG